MSKWINANDELPKETGTYLVAVKREGDIESAVLMAWYDAKHSPFGDYGWTLLNEFYSLNDALRGCITHWMKWPEPPKEEI